jgi:hypothetical protein
MTDDYGSVKLFPTAVPQWSELQDGQWGREWEIRLLEPLDEQRSGSLEELAEEGINVVVAVSADRRTLHVSTITALNPFSDDVFYAAAYRMLHKINESIGQIELIQGQPRNAWRPFRSGL